MGISDISANGEDIEFVTLVTMLATNTANPSKNWHTYLMHFSATFFL